jgi:hypothetical protein
MCIWVLSKRIRTARPTALLSTSKLWRWTGIWPLHTVGSVSPSIAAEKAAKLIKQYGRIAQQAHIIVGASAKAGIKGVVYALAGYNPTADEVIAAFKFYVREEARDYEREFLNQLYQEWYRLYQLPEPERNKPWKFKHLTVNHVYWPLADSKGNILELTKAQPQMAAKNAVSGCINFSLISALRHCVSILDSC